MEKIKHIIHIIKEEGIKGITTRLHNRFSNPEKKEYEKWISANTPTHKELKEQRNHKFQYTPKISIVVPLYNTPKKYLLELIKFTQKQTYTNWELCLADGSTKPLDYLNKVISKEPRIHYQILAENKGISGNTNEALKLVTGDYVALLDHDDLLPVNSLYEIVKVINENPEVEYIFTDEDKFTNIHKHTRYEPNFKPDYSYDTLTSYNYICHFSIFKKELMDKLGGFREEFNGSQDYDLILRAVEQAKHVIHIPAILYHWRVHPNSTAGNAESKPYCYEAGKNAVQEHLKRKGYTNATAEYGVAIVRNKVVYQRKTDSKIQVLLFLQDNRIDLKKLNQEIQSVTYQNYEILLFVTEEITQKEGYTELTQNDKIKQAKTIKQLNLIKEWNIAAQNTNAEQIVFAKDIQTIKHKDIFEQLLGYIQRGDVGVISPRVIYQYTSQQYNGTVYGIDKEKIGYLDYIDVAGSFGYVTRGAVVENYSIIKSEFMMLNKKDLAEANYLDENMDFADSMANLSFALYMKGKLNVIHPQIEVEAPEIMQKTGENCFFKKWEKQLEKPDPNYNINLKFEKNHLFEVKTERVDKA